MSLIDDNPDSPDGGTDAAGREATGEVGESINGVGAEGAAEAQDRRSCLLRHHAIARNGSIVAPDLIGGLGPSATGRAQRRPLRPLMTLAEVARDLGVSRSNAYVYAHRAEIPGLVTLNGRYWVRRAPFEAWLAGRDVAPVSRDPLGLEVAS